MSLPVVRTASQLSIREEARAQRKQRKTTLAVYEEGLRIAAELEVQRMHSIAAADLATDMLTEEFALVDYGLARAGNSVAKLELVARKVQALEAMNSRRLRRFGSS